MSNQKTDMLDKEIECIECKNTFIFSEGEQKYFEDRGLFEPKRCKDCRKKRRKETEKRTWQHKKEHSSQESQGKTVVT